MYQEIESEYISFENHKIHIVLAKNNVLWFHANCVAKALDYKNFVKVIAKYVSVDDKCQLRYIESNHKKYHHPFTNYINESGLYTLILRSRMPIAKKFKRWITSDVLPSIRKYGFYEKTKEYENSIIELQEKITYYTKENSLLKKDLKTEKYPNGGLVYVIDYSTKKDEIYKIGMTNDMAKRKRIYDTHTFHKKTVVSYKKHSCPRQLELCLKSMLYEHRYKNKKEFYLCKLSTIKKALNECVKTINCCAQTGGFNVDEILKELKYNRKLLQEKVRRLKRKLK